MAKDSKKKDQSKISKDDKKMSKEEKKQNKVLAKEEKKRSKEDKKRIKDAKKKSKSSTNLVKEDKKADKSKKGSEKGKSKSSKYDKFETEQNIGGPKQSTSYQFLPTRFELPRGQKGYVFPVTPGPARYPVTRINYPIMKARRQVDLTKKMIAGPSPPAYTMGIRHTEFREFYNKIQ